MTERRLVVLIFALILLLYGVGITLAGLTGAMSRCYASGFFFSAAS